MLRLYYFTSERYGLEAIRDNRLKIARINELNDPFEFLGLALNRGDRRVLTSLKNDLDKQYGLICMSKDWTHPLLWSHYADSHRGLCLGFDIRPSAQHKFQEVIYRKDRPTLKAIRIQDLGGMDLDRTMKLLRTKFDSWTDEGERRAFIGLTDKDPVSDLYFWKLPRSVTLAQVIVGMRSNLTRKKLAEVLGDRANSVQAFKTRTAFREFKVVENKAKRMWK